MAKPLLKIGAVVGVVVAFGIYVWATTRLPAPREENRVTHKHGIYSIIAPPDWETSFNYTGNQRYLDTLDIRLPTPRARTHRIFIGRFREQPDLSVIMPRDHILDDQFQGRNATVGEGYTRMDYYWRAIFERGGQWYELVMWSPMKEDIPNSRWWAYLQSFRAMDEPPAPATLPVLPDIPFELPPQP